MNITIDVNDKDLFNALQKDLNNLVKEYESERYSLENGECRKETKEEGTKFVVNFLLHTLHDNDVARKEFEKEKRDGLRTTTED